ncbi:beach-domain-containing protein [Pluteus cervinus]|uniref:Beach-domain-containing protein n=1 Tax=Pluteus cervinus TaxID=181527 RepID=A0ACD3AIR0_9AGAR|nr:beach-domain-containing protein [Pluteus cervinus]
MLRTLLTPLRARFELTPKVEEAFPPSPVQEEEDELAPEDFARDVLIELMRNSIENLREADGTRAKVQVLAEVQRIMLQDGRTKDVFREMDGFLVLMSVLSGIRDGSGSMIVEPEEQVHSDTVEATRMVFMITSEAMLDHARNTVYFKKEVGYQSLAQAITPLVSDKTTVDETMGYLLALALQDFTVASIFTTLRGVPLDAVDAKLLEYEPRLGTIRYPDAINIFWDMVPQLVADDNDMRYSVFKLFELLSHLSHRNQAILSSIGILHRLFLSYYDMKEETTGTSGLSKKEKSVLQKLLRKLLDMGATTAEARFIFQRAVKEDDTLDPDILDVIKYGMKSRWLEHISMESPAALTLSEDGIKGLPNLGFTFMTWIWISELPNASHTLFKVRLPARELVHLAIRTDGTLELETYGCPQRTVLEHSKLNKYRWTHIALVHHPHRITNPTIRVFIDGVQLDTLHWAYPKSDYSGQTIAYTIGDASSSAQMSWCIASAHFTAAPLGDDLPRLIHHLGPRYYGNFQDPKLVSYLTYEASTSLNMFLSTVATKLPNAVEITSLMKAVRDGLGIAENSVVFAFSPFNAPQSGDVATLPSIGHSKEFKVEADVYVVKAACLDTALWKIGGAAVALRLVQLANTPHEVSRALSILTDGLRNSWQNSEDMERLRGYEVLGDILRNKAQLVNMTGFETLFEFLGLNFRTPEQSTIVNVVAYKAIALDLELWSRTRKEIQRVYLEHFTTLLLTSRYKKFNGEQRMSKMGVVRKLLFALQTDWYQHDMLPFLIEAIKAAALAHFSKDDAIKPIVSYIAANLHQESDADGTSTPRSVVSRTDNKDSQQKAEQILEVLISIISVQTYFNQFCAALPLTRICLLLLGERPSPVTATQILLLIGTSLQKSSAFSRKFELITGWSVLKTILPFCWDPSVNEAAIDVLLGRTPYAPRSAEQQQTREVCPQVVPVILSALQHGLGNVATNSRAETASLSNASDTSSHFSSMNESTMEVLIEELMDLHASNANFRDVFTSHSTTQVFVDGYKGFVDKVGVLPEINQRIVRLLEKLGHFGLALALGNEVAGSQKREILDTLQKADVVLNPTATKMAIDPRLVADTRSVRQRITSTRFSMQVGERTIMKTITRMSEWRKSIQDSEKKRLRKNFLDLRETRRQVSRLYEWTQLLINERGVWPHPETKMWRLDETEGPHRIRKKLEPENYKAPSSRVDGTGQQIRDVHAPEADTASSTEVPPWAETYEISATETDADRQLAEEITDDKHRRIRHELEPGDVIDAVTTVARMAGVDSSPGLLIIGRSHLYMLDGLVENDDGEVVDAHDAPKRLFFVPGSIVELDGPQRAQRWSHEQIASFSDKTFLFRDVALEIFFKDSRSLLIVFLDKDKRLFVDQRLASMIAKFSTELATTPSFVKTARFGKSSANAKSTTSLKVNDLSTAQRKWQAREISNFTYLSILNQISGRTPSDATQYPVFPWVIKDYTSQNLDLTSPDAYRDLTKPMGALNEGRREAATQRYANLQGVDEDPFHYGTHFSSSMIVCHFLIRLSPFTNMFKTLQGGDWDLPDRLFSDLARAYESAAIDVRGDVRELIPEFFTCPEFLENSANLDFGVLQHTGERIHDVKLPPWARQDPLLFITQNRRALESDYVSEHLPAWIDLIWGCKQRDPESLNCFHPLSYEGSIDLDSITDELEREATIGIIHNFGQTPRKLFTTSHPQRFNHGLSTLPIGTLHGIEEDPHLLVQDTKPLKDLGASVPVRELSFDTIGERLIPCPEGVLCAPTGPHEQVEWRVGSAELKVLVDRKVVQVVENAYCNCASFADSQSLVTGSSDYTVRLWKVTRSATSGGAYNSMRIHLSHIMRTHTDEVTCVTASRTWSLVVSGSKDGSAALWDLNRGVYVRSIWHGSPTEPDPVNLVAINDSTGYIATCSKLKLCLHTINARPLATLDLTTTLSYSALVPTITAMAFHEREFSHLGVLATGGPDGSIALRTWTADGTPEGEKARWEFLTIRSMKVRTTENGVTRPPSVTALKFLGESLCHGEETGKAYLWRLPE